jgi:Fasciclin domain
LLKTIVRMADRMLVEQPAQLDSVGTYQLDGHNDLCQRPIRGTIYETIAKRFPMFFRFMYGSLSVNRLNDPWSQKITIFVPKIPIHTHFNKDLILQHVVLPYMIRLEEISGLQSLQSSEGGVIRVSTEGRRLKLDDSVVIGGNILCSNGLIHVTDRLIEPYILKKYDTY